MDLEKVLERFIDFVKYAETKHAVIIAFNSTIIVALFGVKLSNIDSIFVVSVIILLLMTNMIALYSFFPDLKRVIKNNEENIEDLNLLYFGDVVKLTNDQYVSQIVARYELDDLTKYQKDLCDQIYQNARIAVKKFQLFKTVIKMELFVIVYAVLIIIIN